MSGSMLGSCQTPFKEEARKPNPASVRVRVTLSQEMVNLKEDGAGRQNVRARIKQDEHSRLDGRIRVLATLLQNNKLPDNDWLKDLGFSGWYKGGQEETKCELLNAAVRNKCPAGMNNGEAKRCMDVGEAKRGVGDCRWSAEAMGKTSERSNWGSRTLGIQNCEMPSTLGIFQFGRPNGACRNLNHAKRSITEQDIARRVSRRS
ncbi:hypothetical protein C8R45DRAFT_948251 [Mycena sanguinolenta]|nr:hypothetical protein C8R45DRAFT_948251 [Mycena sanguinolenta]